VKPKLIIARLALFAARDFKRFREIADSVGAISNGRTGALRFWFPAGRAASPVPYAHVTTTPARNRCGGPRGGFDAVDDETLTRSSIPPCSLA